LRTKAGFAAAETREILQASHADAMVAEPAPLSKRVCRDPSDDRILAAALGADADVIATGDRDLLDLKRMRAIFHLDWYR
jgi:putative PIN family toxin of toxin-antitoxin system